MSFTNKQIRTLIHLFKTAVSKKYLKVPKSLEEMKKIWMKSLEIKIGNRQFWITGDGYKSFWEIINLLSKDKFISDHISVGSLSKYVKESIIKYFKDQDGHDVLIRQLLEKLSTFNEKREFWFIIDGISFKDVNVLEIGKATFIKAGEKEAGIFHEKLSPLKKQGKITPTPFEYKKIKNSIKEKRENLIGKIIAKCVVDGDFDKGKEKAFNIVQEALNVLRLYTIVFFPASIKSKQFQINIQGYTYGGIEDVVAFNIKTNDKSRFLGRGISKIRNLEISKEIVEVLKEYGGLEEFTSFLKKNNVSEFDQIFKKALYWTGDGINDPNPHSTYIKFVTALEVLFGPREKEWIACPGCGKHIHVKESFIKKSIAKGVAVTVGEDIQNIKELYKRAKKYYDYRSNILHEGIKEDLPLKEVAEITCLAILRLLPLHSSFKNWSQVLSEIDRLSNIAKL